MNELIRIIFIFFYVFQKKKFVNFFNPGPYDTNSRIRPPRRIGVVRKGLIKKTLKSTVFIWLQI